MKPSPDGDKRSKKHWSSQESVLKNIAKLYRFEKNMSKQAKEDQRRRGGWERRRSKTSQRTIGHSPCGSKKKLRDMLKQIEQCETNQLEL